MSVRQRKAAQQRNAKQKKKTHQLDSCPFYMNYLTFCRKCQKNNITINMVHNGYDICEKCLLELKYSTCEKCNKNVPTFMGICINCRRKEYLYNSKKTNQKTE